MSFFLLGLGFFLSLFLGEVRVVGPVYLSSTVLGKMRSAVVDTLSVPDRCLVGNRTEFQSAQVSFLLSSSLLLLHQ